MTMPQTRHYEMKDSGVDWIGRMPDGWSRDKINRIYDVIGSGTTPKFDDAKDNSGPVNWIQSGDVYSGGSITKVKNQIAESFLSEYSALKLYQPPFVVIAMYGASIGNMAVSAISGCVNQACCVLGKPRGDFNYAYYALQALKKHLLSSALGGGQPNISQQIIKAQWLPMPPLSEQTAIAAYLDEKCATIDAIIAEAKASIEEYKSWKASVIFETVTKGLNPNAEMKDSGVEWIGEIPKGWKVSAVKRHYSITLGKMLESVPQSNDATLENYMCASNVKWGGIDTTTNRQMWFSPIEKEEYLLKEGDLLVMEGGSAGTSAIYRGEYAPCYMQNSVNRCRSKDGSLTHFLYYWMFLVYHSGHVESACNRATIIHLTKEKLGRLPFVYAPKEEQASIVSYLDRKCSLIDGIILEKEDLIRELETYKRSLIFEVVTGKRRVC